MIDPSRRAVLTGFGAGFFLNPGFYPLAQAENNPVPLIATASLEEGLQFPDFGPPPRLGLMNYIGSAARSTDGRRIAFSSPVGNRLIIIDATRRNIALKADISDVCGIAAARNRFFTTSLSGEFNRPGEFSGQEHPLYWDNHMSAIG